ncbi:MAG TPA: hypothetical protein VIP46_00885 [Pyrinomonadaceae bacterium]
MRFLSRSGSSDAARVRRAALVLLLLTLHAFQAGATHLPQPAQPPPTRTVHAHPSGESWGATTSTASTESVAHAQCLLCRLQRSLSTGLGNSAPVAFSPPLHWLLVESAAADAPRSTPTVASSGRAPPCS